jgi:hypothetical protein
MNDLEVYYERHRRHIGAAWQPACTDAVASMKWIGGEADPTVPIGDIDADFEQVGRDLPLHRESPQLTGLHSMPVRKTQTHACQRARAVAGHI